MKFVGVAEGRFTFVGNILVGCRLEVDVDAPIAFEGNIG